MGIFSIFKNREKRKEAEKYRIGMEKTRNGAFARLKKVFSNYNQITEDLFDELEEIFVMADIGVDTVVKFIDELKSDERVKGLESAKDLQPIIVDKMFDIYLKGEVVNSNLRFNKEGLSVFLFVGVNGVGKTTTIAKVANKLKKEGKSVLIAAADTFRAGATEQLEVWGDRVGCKVVTGPEGSDPSSVIYKAIQVAKEEKYDVLICDTAGRLHNKKNLMNELQKISKIIHTQCEESSVETLLVLAATTGQNAVNQTKQFMEVADITGIVLTKLDGTAKGGIIISIADELKIPVKLIGVGEQIDDLQTFSRTDFANALFD